MSKDQTESLPVWLVVLGWCMRRIPRGPRKLEYWWWQIFRRIGGGEPFDDKGGRDWPQNRTPFTIRGRHGVVYVNELHSWTGRYDYFRGSYYQDDIVFMLENLVRKGDIVVDAGANRAMITSLAGRLVGPSGSVYAFEPNPHLIPVIEHHIKLNEFTNVKLFNCGLSDRSGSATIVADANPGLGWVAIDGLPEGKEGYAIQLAKGDDILGDLEPSRPVIVKMDVEGHDVHALRGLSRFLDRRELALICEVSRDNQSRVGSTPEELFRMMQDRGFGVFRFDIVQSRWRRSLRLTTLEAPLEIDPYEVLFIRPATALWHRLQGVRSE